MAKQTIDLGNAPNSRSGDTIRKAFERVNDNFTELYALIGGSGGVDLTEMVQDYAAAMFTSGTHTGISVVYNDTGNKMNLTVQIDGGDASTHF